MNGPLSVIGEHFSVVTRMLTSVRLSYSKRVFTFFNHLGLNVPCIISSGQTFILWGLEKESSIDDALEGDWVTSFMDDPFDNPQKYLKKYFFSGISLALCNLMRRFMSQGVYSQIVQNNLVVAQVPKNDVTAKMSKNVAKAGR